MWKSDTPEPERGGPTLTASGVGFVGGGDGNLRAFDAKTGTVLWKFQTGAQIADGPSVYSVNGTEYVAIGVGGTPDLILAAARSLSQVQVFDLGGSSTQSTAPVINGALPGGTAGSTASASSTQHGATASQGQGALCVRSAARPARSLDPDRAPREAMGSELLEHAGRSGSRASGRQAGRRSAQVKVGGWIVPQLTDSSGALHLSG